LHHSIHTDSAGTLTRSAQASVRAPFEYASAVHSRERQSFERLNRSRIKSGKAPLLDHIEVRAPLLPEYRTASSDESESVRRSPRLHHVRGHLVRRGSQLFWRVPHLRGSARLGVVRSRTVQLSFH